jgi:hypothetical protein
MSTFFKRLYWAARLDWLTFEEIKADPRTLPQALGLLLYVSVLEAHAEYREYVAGSASFLGLLVWLWLGYALGIWGLRYVGQRLFLKGSDPPSFAQIVQTTGFASGPLILAPLALIPWVGAALGIAAVLWSSVAYFQAVRVTFALRSFWEGILLAVLGGFLAGIGWTHSCQRDSES